MFKLYKDVLSIFLETASPNIHTYMEENSDSWREVLHCSDQNSLLLVQVLMPVSMTMHEFARFLPLLGYIDYKIALFRVVHYIDLVVIIPTGL